MRKTQSYTRWIRLNQKSAKLKCLLFTVAPLKTFIRFSFGMSSGLMVGGFVVKSWSEAWTSLT